MEEKMKVEIRRKWSSVYLANRVVVWAGDSCLNSFPDTPEGLEEARQCHAAAVEKIESGTPLNEVLLSEDVEVKK
jgi:hypothetical protein